MAANAPTSTLAREGASSSSASAPLESGSQKMNALAAQLRQVAYRLGPSAKMPTFAELRAHHGLSQATVMAALDKLQAENIVVRRRGSGVYVSPDLGQSTLCVLCKPSLLQQPHHSPFWDALLEDIEARAATERELVQMHFTRAGGALDEALRSRLRRHRERGELHGVLGLSLDPDSAQWLEEMGFPFVSVFGWAKAALFLDMDNAIETGVRALKERGSQRIEVWWAAEMGVNAGLVAQESSERRAQTVRAVGERTGLSAGQLELRDFSAGLGAEMPRIAHTTAEQGRLMALERFAGPPSTWPDGLVIIDDHTSAAALETLQKRGVRPGEDVQVACHANAGSPVLTPWRDQVFLLEFSPRELVCQAFALLERSIADPALCALGSVPPRLVEPGGASP